MPPPPHPAVPTTDSRGPSRRSAVLTQPRSRPTASTQAPAVFPLVSCCEGTSTAALSVTLGCLVRDYFPGPVTVTWDVGTLTKNTVTFPATLHSTSNLYTTISQVTASGEWATQKFTCQVEHPGSAAVSRSFRVCATNYTQPTVKLLHSSCDPSGDTHATVQLLCLISDFTPGDIEVTWLVDGQKAENVFPYISPHKQEGKLASAHSQLNITQGQWVSQSTYTCRVNYLGFIIEDHARSCPESEPRGVSVYLIPPSPLDLYIHKSPKITCLVVDLASVDGMSLKWSREGEDLVDKATEVPKHHFNMTYTVTSTLPVDADDWIEGVTYRCEVSHPHLPRAIARTIAKTPGKRAAPEVYVFLPPEESQGTKDTVTLTCLVQNFFPVDISVQWLRNDAPVQTDQQATTQPLKANSSSPAFFVFSRLEVRRADWEKRDKFTCQVVHEALPGSRTLKKSVSKEPGN
ncbi:Ig epsilon chain C region [Pteropus alecto]|uniref:Ig epsilon chain C region n=1 Tax=Pteropus alecto TaxID=9402 RepID=L5JR68_PTEAL|nr:Ig epsilon chain C region [Pteropus alecto]